METKLFKSKEESRKAYKEYVEEHIKAVQTCFRLFGMNIIKFITKESNRFIISSNSELYEMVDKLVSVHDRSKFSPEEFDAYAAKFKRSKERSKMLICSSSNRKC